MSKKANKRYHSHDRRRAKQTGYARIGKSTFTKKGHH